MASSIDFVVKNGLQVSTNLVVGTYTLNTTPISNGAIISGSVGIGTSNPLQLLHVSNGNAYINNSVWAGNISITNATASSSTTSGALIVAGGVGIAGNIYLGTTNSNVFNTVAPIFSNTGTTAATLNAINVIQTWNNSGNAFQTVAINITDSASATGSTPIAIIRNNVTQFSLPSSSLSSWSDASVGAMYVTATNDLSTTSLSALNGNNYAGLQLKRYISSRGPGVLVSGLAFSTAGFFGSTSLNSSDVLLTAGGTNSLQLGDADTATPQPFSFQMPSVVGGTSNTAGTDFLLQGSRGTGTGVGGRLLFGISPAGASGSAQNSISNVLIIDPSTNVSTFSSAVSISNTRITTSSTTGALVVSGGVGVANGAVIAGNVGIGTASTAGFTNNVMAVFGNSLHKGNVYITNTSTISGIFFSDGTFQNTASSGGAGTTGPTGPTGPTGATGQQGGSPSISVYSYTTSNSSTSGFSTVNYTSGSGTAYVTVYVNGVYQPTTSYNWSGSVVTLNSPAPNNASVELVMSVANVSVQPNAVISSTNGIFISNSNISASYVIPNGFNALSVGPITLNTGVTVTVPAGQRWVVV